MHLESLSVNELKLKRRGIKRELLLHPGLQPVRIAVFGGSTTNEVVDILEIFLLDSGFQPTFYQGEYGSFYQDTVIDSRSLIAFCPDIVYLHTSVFDVQAKPPAGCTEAEFNGYVNSELDRYSQVWEAIERSVSAQIIQNNFEFPPHALLGNIDTVSSGGVGRFFLALNEKFARAAASNRRLLLQDIHRLSAEVGLSRWFDWERYFNYKILLTPDASAAIARTLTSIVRSIYGKSRKVLVLDLDNTLWGGVIGDDGVDRIQIGRETPVAESYTAFQEYCVSLHKRGVLLAVCSKNDEHTARQGFEHPDSVLKLHHFSCFKANWKPKDENILAIARELNLGADSFVFVDDNPAERAIVEAQIAGIAVPDVGTEVSHFASIIQAGRYFEPISILAEDMSRAALYHSDSHRASSQAKFSNYGEYLDSLEMFAEIDTFKPVYVDRIAQLTNKTNQFNLTTRRYTLSQIEAVLHDRRHIGLYGKLSDRFGDNGLISVVLGRRENSTLHLDLWLMSCRVLKRDMELAMLDALVDEARMVGIDVLLGYYFPTGKNGMVADHYEKLGFKLLSDDGSNATTWTLDVTAFSPRSNHIKITKSSNA